MAQRQMEYYFRLARLDGRTKKPDPECFYGFEAAEVTALHTTRLFAGPPSSVEQGLWFRLDDGIVVDAVTARSFSKAESAAKFYDIAPTKEFAMARIKNPDFTAEIKEEILHVLAHMKASPAISIEACLSTACHLALMTNKLSDAELIAMLELWIKKTRERGLMRLS
jgi:hypothetical protein